MARPPARLTEVVQCLGCSYHWHCTPEKAERMLFSGCPECGESMEYLHPDMGNKPFDWGTCRRCT